MFATSDRVPGQFAKSAPVYEGKCQEKYLPSELKPDDNLSWHSAPLARDLRVLAPRGTEGIADRREARVAGHFPAWLSLLAESVVQDGPERSRARR
jgi:hypothetical protein